MRIKVSLIALSLLLPAGTMAAGGKVYKWEGEDGNDRAVATAGVT